MSRRDGVAGFAHELGRIGVELRLVPSQPRDALFLGGKARGDASRGNTSHSSMRGAI